MNPLPAFFLVLYLGMPPVQSLTPFATAEDCYNAMQLVIRSFPGSAKGGCLDTSSLLGGLEVTPWHPPIPQSVPFPYQRGVEKMGDWDAWQFGY
jgi:hypothetical protein